MLSVVTWSQQEDPRWFGGNIPAKTKSVEFVSVGTGANAYSYQRYEGSPLKKVAGEDGAAPNERAAYLLGQTGCSDALVLGFFAHRMSWCGGVE